jgi:hypothetical protein
MEANIEDADACSRMLLLDGHCGCGFSLYIICGLGGHFDSFYWRGFITRK